MYSISELDKCNNYIKGHISTKNYVHLDIYESHLSGAHHSEVYMGCTLESTLSRFNVFL